MLTPAQQQLAEAVDSMRANDELITNLALALKKAEAERDAYYQHLESSQAEVARLQETVTALRLRVFELESDLSRPVSEPAHEAPRASATVSIPEAQA